MFYFLFSTKQLMATKFDIYDCITNTELIHLLVDY